MDLEIQLLAILASGLLLLVVLELVRREAFLERYALLWLFSAAVLLGLSIWKRALDTVADAIGIAYPPNALFLIAFGFVLVLLLHFSVAVSRLSDQTKVLAQRMAMLEERQRTGEARLEAGDSEAEPVEAETPKALEAVSRFGRVRRG